jgi:hypothetical protein
MKRFALFVTLLAAMSAARAMEQSSALLSMPSEVLAEITAQLAPLEIALEEKTLPIHWIKFFKRIQHLRTVCTYFRTKLLREPGDVDRVLSAVLPAQSLLRPCLTPLFAKSAPETDLEKKLLAVASEPASIEGLNLFKQAFENKQWNTASFALGAMPLSHLMPAFLLFGENCLDENIPSKKLLEIIAGREPDNQAVKGVLLLMTPQRENPLEHPDAFCPTFYKFWALKNRDTAQTVQYFLEHYPFADSDRILLEKLCSKSKKDGDELSLNFEPMSYKRGTRYLAFLSAVSCGSLDLAKALLNKIPQAIISISLLVAMIESDTSMFRMLFNALLPNPNDSLLHEVLLAQAFENDKIDNCACIFEKLGLDEQMQQRSLGFLKASKREHLEEMHFFLNEGVPQNLIEGVVSSLVARKNTECLNLLLKKLHEFGIVRDLVETQLLPQAHALSNTVMIEFLATLLKKLQGPVWWEYPAY